MQTKVDQCIAILKHNPTPSREQIRAIMQDIACSERTVYNALERVHEANRLAQARQKPKCKKKGGRTRTPPVTTIIDERASPEILLEDDSKNVIPRIPKGMEFEHFCRYHSYPMYNGLYRWQVNWFHTVWHWQYSLTLVARDHGKSIGHSNICQWAMTQGWDVIYLGWTSRRKQIAEFVYNFFLQRGELVLDKTSSAYHFKSEYGTKFDTYSVKSKEILGMHEVGVMEREIIPENEYLENFIRDSDRPLLMIIDDAIDDTFMKERYKEESLEQFFSSTIININPDKLMTVGTHKFEGDFYFWLQTFFDDELIVYKRGPFLTEEDPRYDKEPDNPTNLLCPERWIDEDHPDYQLFLDVKQRVKEGTPIKTLIPYEQNLARRKDLSARRKQIGEYWYSSEYEQNPHPILGEVWEKVQYVEDYKTQSEYDLILISIDRAPTTNKTSDYTGITIGRREYQGGRLLITNDKTQKIRITELMKLCEQIYTDFRKDFGYNATIKFIVEKQGGGDDFIALSEDSGCSFAHAIIPVHTTRKKEERIQDVLYHPITNSEIVFLDPLRWSELIKEILSFPHCAKFDALDSLCNMFMEMLKLPSVRRFDDKLLEQLTSFRMYNSTPKSWEELIQATMSRRAIF